MGSRFFDYGTDPEESVPVPLFLTDASVEDWALVVGHCERRRFRAGEVVVRFGDVEGRVVGGIFLGFGDDAQRAQDARNDSVVLSDDSINRIGAGDWTALAAKPVSVGV